MSKFVKDVVDSWYWVRDDLDAKNNFASELVSVPVALGAGLFGQFGTDSPSNYRRRERVNGMYLGDNGWKQIPKFHSEDYSSAVTSRDEFNNILSKMKRFNNKKAAVRGRRRKFGGLTRPNGQQRAALARFKARAKLNKQRLKARPGSYKQPFPRNTGNRGNIQTGSVRGIDQPVDRKYQVGLGTRLNISTKSGGDVANVPFKLWDDVVSAFYPLGGANPANFIVLGSVATSCGAEYIVAPIMRWYTPDVIRQAVNNYSWFAIDSFSLSFVPCVNYQNNGEVFLDWWA